MSNPNKELFLGDGNMAFEHISTLRVNKHQYYDQKNYL